MNERKVRVGPPARTPSPAAQRVDYDVIVVGGRVAGASTAMLLARLGHRVLVIERSPMPSDTVSTHAITRTGILQLRRWGLLGDVEDLATPPVRQVTLGFGDDRVEFGIRPEHGVDTFYAPRRQLLDDVILRRAGQAGCEVSDRTTVTDLLRDQAGVVSGVRVGRGDDVEEITARMVIGADGHHSKIARLVDSAYRRRHPATNAVHYAYYTDVDVDGFWFQFTPGMNTGAIPTNNGLTLLFAGRPRHLQRRFTDDPDGEMARLVSESAPELGRMMSTATRVSRFHGSTGLAGFIRQTWGPGWALVGDAGYTKDPISAHGISDALRDAELCARAIDRALVDPSDSAAAFDWYETLRDSLSRQLFEESRVLAGYEWDAAEASARMRAISQTVRDECDLLASLPAWGAVPGMARL